MDNNLRRRRSMQMAYYKYSHTPILYVLLLILGIASCNNDVFVEHLPEVEDILYLDGYNGKQTIQIKKDALKFISIGDYYSYDERRATVYYNKEGEEINNPKDIKNIAKITYINRIFAIELNIKNDEIEIVCLDNTYGNRLEAWLNLDYGYMDKNVILKISDGIPYEISQFGYAFNGYSTKTETKNGYKENFHNNTDQPIRITIYPYKDAQSNLTLTPDEEEYWSSLATGLVSVPYFKNGEWNIDDTEEVEAIIGDSTWFNSSIVNQEEETYVEVPPNSSVRITEKITFAILETHYSAWLLMPNTDILWPTSGTLTISQPISYQIESTPLDL